MARWNRVTENFAWNLLRGARSRRNALFMERLAPVASDTLLDLGSEDGGQNRRRFTPIPARSRFADISATTMERGVASTDSGGYQTLEPNGPLPFADGAFDIVYCNSVIEHVTTDIWLPKRRFRAEAWEHQRQFAAEIRRVSRAYYVQTPNRHFPIEAHSLLPFGGYLSGRMNARLGRWMKRWWIKQWSGDSNLLTRKQLVELSLTLTSCRSVSVDW